MGFLANPSPLLAGVCSRLATLLGCNVWALRAVFIVILLVKTFWAAVVYTLLALVFQAAGRLSPRAGSDEEEEPARETSDWTADSARNQRIRDLDRRFRAWEETLNK
jgi:phage shock protein PspC (stress-responsive transcriptional regulator)